MQGVWYKIKAGFRRFMIGRHGVDQLSIALLYLAVIASLINSFFLASSILSLVSFAVYAYALFRMLSKNNAARYKENAWYLKRFGDVPQKVKQAWVRFKNRKTYLYFDCPECHAKLRVPRGKGEVTVTCGRCGHKARKQA